MFLASKTHIISTATLSKKRISQASSDLNHPFNGLEPSSVLFITSTPWCNSTINIAINESLTRSFVGTQVFPM
ncbi:hypothetical protein BT96DRAFT_1010796 [Gymnopus androsaceus JB14]|uniref:Uncharacterized protein n=1 Tax=Gymnopus androsaceus JB14 TaxID=1447944 RepID=A0A6A4GA49_9AGAR|nr:hypothetical protein BT96DRAFT_1010796 [Gymnopus androsaceus JB14]